MDDKQIAGSFAQKRRKVLIKFRTIEEIINRNAAWFDQYGNLRVAEDHHATRVTHLTPSSFRYLGKTVEMPSHHSYPSWAIENEWDDLFGPNMALRVIASGKLSQADMVALAKKAVLIPHPGSESESCNDCGSIYCGPCEAKKWGEPNAEQATKAN